MQYQLVYDAAAAGYTDWWFPAGGLIVFFGIPLVIYLNRRQRFPLARVIFGVCGMAFVAFWIATSAYSTFGNYWHLRNALRDGEFTVVEGVVENFAPSDAGDHTKERWQVTTNGVVHEYQYVASELTPGFRQTAIHGGPIHEGLHVRIADVDGYIARLEVQR